MGLESFWDRKISREEFLAVSGNLGKIAVLSQIATACSRTVPPIPNSDSWPQFTVPMSFKPGEAMQIMVPTSTPDIGLKEVWLWSTAEDYPGLAVFTLWDPKRVKTITPGRFFSDLEVDGQLDFQDFNEPFTIDTSERKIFGGTGYELFRTLEGRFALKAGTQFKSKMSDRPYRLLSRARPITDQPQVLIFGERMVECDGKISPPAYLRMKLLFEHTGSDQPPPTSVPVLPV